MKNVLVIGAAKSGIAASFLLKEKGYTVYLTDAKKIKEKEELEAKGIFVYEEGHPDLLKEIEYEFIVKNPGIPYRVPFVDYFVKKGVTILNEIEVAARFVSYRYGAITGTNGKTTTTTLLGEFLKRLNPENTAVGNIGLPLSEVVLKHPQEQLSLAVEVAAFQLLGFERFHPEVSVCLNLTPDHLDYFKDLSAYYEAKMRIYQNQTKDDWFLLNLDDENVLNYAKDIPATVVTYSMVKPADLMLEGDRVTLFGEVLFEKKDLKIPGMHNLQNAMVASAMAYKMGVSKEDILDVLRHFKGVEHRLQYVDTVCGVAYYNDSKGTNADSTIVALKAFDQKVILLAGGYDKKIGFDAVIPYLDKVKTMIVYGETREQLKDIYPDAIVVNNLKEATLKAKEIAKEGDVVLLSPMCASWDQFDNFEQRGHFFVDLVEQL